MGGDWGSDAEGPSDGSICLRIADFDYAKGVFQHKPQEEYTYRCYSPEKFNALKLRIGDLLVEKSGGGDLFPVGRAVRFDLQLDAAYANFMDRLRARESVACSAFLLYQWNVMYSSRLTYSYLKQTTGIQNLQLTDLLNEVCFVVPPLGDQRRIVNYLDEKTVAIDVRVAVLEKKLAAYKRLKTSIINQAVTRGLDPNAKLKDSGVDWIGQVPEGWKVLRAKDFGDVVRGVSYKPEDLRDEDDGVLLLRACNIEDGTVVYDDKVYVAAKCVASEKYLRKDDLLICATNGSLRLVGKAAIISVHQEQTFGAFMLVLRVTCAPKFALYQLGVVVEYIRGTFTTTTINQLSTTQLETMRFCMPNSEEQQAIADYLDAECVKIDRAAEIVTREIDAYKRLKRSLINEVVTGKRKVA